MRIGIVTFQETNNYGAILQNFALQKAIKKYGYTVETIDYQSEYIAKPYRLIHYKNKGFRKYIFGVIGFLCYLPRSNRNNWFRKEIQYSEPIEKKDLYLLNKRYDCFIAGSDQVWNVNLTGDDDTYFLNFVEDGSKKNGYAASVGISQLTDKQKVWYADKLKDFHIVSVREKASVLLLKEFLSNDIENVLDPVFLLERAEWEKYALEPIKEKDYILVYQLGIFPEFIKYAKRCAAKYKCKLIFFPFPLGGMAIGKYKISAGAGDLVSYIRGARYVITDSFHGTALAIIFNKKFTTLVSGTHSAVSIRLTSMLEQFHLLHRVWNNKINLDEHIDYVKINEIVKIERRKSYQTLEKIFVDEESTCRNHEATP